MVKLTYMERTLGECESYYKLKKMFYMFSGSPLIEITLVDKIKLAKSQVTLFKLCL